MVGVFTDHIFAWPLFLDVASRIYASAREAHAARARLSAATPRPRTCPPPAGYPLQSVAGSQSTAPTQLMQANMCDWGYAATEEINAIG